jgi:hypothetical protein
VVSSTDSPTERNMNVENLKEAFAESTGHEPIQSNEVVWPDQNAEDILALKLVVQNSQRARSFLSSKGHPSLWRAFDRLWNFQLDELFWPGTNIPRSNLSIPLVLEHTESILPQVTLGFFADEQPFEVAPRPGTAMDVARANAALLSWELQETKFRQEFRLLSKSALLYGSGIGKWGWETCTRRVTKYRRKQEAVAVDVGFGTEQIHPDSDEVEAYEADVTINRPKFQHVNLRHVLVDPGLRVPDIREADYVIHVMYMGVDEIDSLREYEGYQNIPDRESLLKLVAPNKDETPYRNPIEANSDISLFPSSTGQKAMARAEENSADPLSKPFEILEYWSKDRVYTVFQRKLVIRNERNPYGRIPFVSCAFIDVMDAFYGIGVGRLIGNEQRLQQGVLNLALDVESLKLGGAFVRKRAFNAPTQEIRLSPGRVIDVDDPSQFKALEFTSVFSEALAILASSDSRAQRHTAASEMAVQGSMPSRGSNLLRTAAGIDMLTSGTGSRLQYFIENLADLVFVPVLEAFNEMNAANLKPSQFKQILSDELDQAFSGDPLDIMNGGYKFKILAGAKLQAKRALAQNIPLFFQFIANEPVMNQLAMQGKKVDFGELTKMVFDVTGWPNKQSLIVPMTDEEKQMFQQMNAAMQQTAAQQQKIQLETESKSQLISQQNEEKVARDIIRDSIKKHEESLVE